MKVALVIGHTKISPGACNDEHNICEFEFNELLVNDVKNLIARDYYEMDIVYRDTYKDLPDKINKLNPDFVISFHCNAFNKKASGSETLYYHTSKKGKEIAKLFQKRIVEALGLPDRGIKGRKSDERGGYILRYTKAPCILIEPFFIDNNDDYRIIKDKYILFVEAIKDSIYDTFGVIVCRTDKDVVTTLVSWADLIVIVAKKLIEKIKSWVNTSIDYVVMKSIKRLSLKKEGVTEDISEVTEKEY